MIKKDSMSEDSKYYVPQITEFHVGFEYEFSDLDHDLKNTKWFTEIVPVQFNTNYYLECLTKKDWIRVKFLDKADIESCGWVKVWNELDELSFQLNKWIMTFVPSRRELIITQGEEHRIFQGTIRNLSELLTLMKQLGINE